VIIVTESSVLLSYSRALVLHKGTIFGPEGDISTPRLRHQQLHAPVPQNTLGERTNLQAK